MALYAIEIWSLSLRQSDNPRLVGWSVPAEKPHPHKPLGLLQDLADGQLLLRGRKLASYQQPAGRQWLPCFYNPVHEQHRIILVEKVGELYLNSKPIEFLGDSQSFFSMADVFFASISAGLFAAISSLPFNGSGIGEPSALV
jgi:hypothetical protein